MASGTFGPSGSQRVALVSYDTTIALGSNEYVNGSVTISLRVKSAATGASVRFGIYLGASGTGTETYIGTREAGSDMAREVTVTASVSDKAYKGKTLTVRIIAEGQIWIYGEGAITAATSVDSYSVSTASGGNGSLSASVSSAQPGATVTLYPSPNTGYELDHYSASPAVSFSGNTFTMPSGNITVTAYFRKKTYTLTRKASPAGGGSVSYSGTLQAGNTITLSQTPAAGYYFNGWSSSPAVAINANNQFTMPAANVTVTANYLRRSTAATDRTEITGGDTVTLTVSTESANYTHKYQLSWGTGMETAEATLEAGVTTAAIAVPAAWSEAIPNAARKQNGVLTLKTYSGSTLIGTYQVTGLTYVVPDSAWPEFTSLAHEILRTVNGITYADVGDYYVQGHCGVRVTAEAESGLGAGIESISVAVSGYEGGSYNRIALDDEIDFSSGLLGIAGETTVTVTAADSRARTVTETFTVSVVRYNAPSISALSAWRVNVDGEPDDRGIYAQYAFAYSFEEIGTNAATRTLEAAGDSAVNPPGSGNLLPGNRKTFDEMREHNVTLTVSDAFESVSLTVTLPSAKFVIYVDPDGDRIGFGKVANKAIPAGKSGTIEISDSLQIFYGNQTLEDYIQSIINA